MKTILAISLVSIVILTVGFIMWRHFMISNAQPRTLTMALPATWGPLTPPEQSTLYAELVLGNVFEPLVDNDAQGNLIPGSAKSWRVSPDLRRYEFRIDTSRRFSDGQALSARIYKRSLEHSLTVQPASANSSSLDLIYQIEGYEDFAQTRELRGVIAEGDEILILKFKYPFRQALFQLTGVRFAAYVLDKTGRYLGTGPYQIKSHDKDKVLLVQNPYSRKHVAYPSAEIHALGSSWAVSYCKGLYDVFWLMAGLPEDCPMPEGRSFVLEAGAFMNHTVADVNGASGRLLAEPNLRLALQYVFYRHVLDEVAQAHEDRLYQKDIQFFQPLQAGRLPAEEAEKLVMAGEKWVNDLAQASRDKPIHVCAANKIVLDRTVSALTKAGITVKAELIDFAELMNRAYKTLEYDVLLSGAGTGGLDPDDLYHYLGQNGAITSPGIGRPGVWDAFERGRKLTDPEVINQTYQQANRAILTEVPSIHLGFFRSGLLYGQDRVVFDASSLNTERFNLSQFKPQS